MTINNTLRKHILDFHVDGIKKSAFAVYIYLLMMASDRDKMLGELELKKGQCIVSQKVLSQKTGFTEAEIRGAVKELKEAGYITTSVPDKCTIYTVLAYVDESESVEKAENTLTLEQERFISLYRKKFEYQEILSEEEETFFNNQYSQNLGLMLNMHALKGL